MIPVRVELTNFLSHRRPDGTPVVFDFDGAKLWSVSGDNGAGKSAIFDGITWTLYGVHRGGRQDAQRLISHGADGCKAAFDFEVDGRRYRVERSLRRRGTLKRRARRWDAVAGEWEEIPGTSAEAGFSSWRAELLPLSYDAFTHSVLLLQAGSDALIRSGAKDRFEVLAQLVDLSRYQRLERLAQAKSSELTGRRRQLEEELAALEPVADEERKAAAAEVKGLEQQQRRCGRAVEAQVDVLGGAQRHGDLVRRLDQTRELLGPAEQLVLDAEQTRAEAKEYAALTAAGPKLRDGVAALTAARTAETAIEKARASAEQIELDRLQREAGDARAAAAAASGAVDACAAQATALASALPAVTVVVGQRVELAAAEAELEATGTVADLDALLKRFKAHVRKLEAAASKAVAARDAAAKEQAVRAAELEQAQRRLETRHAARDEAVCSWCGQPVDEQHRALELRRAEEAVEHAERESAAILDRHAALADTAATAVGARDEAVELHRQAEGRRAEAKSAEQRVARARSAAAKALAAAAFTGWDDERQRTFAGAGVDADAAERASATADPPKRASEAADPGELVSALADLEAELEQLNERAAEAERAAAEATATAEGADVAHAAALKSHAELERVAEQARTEATTQHRHADLLLADVPAEWADRARQEEEGLTAAFEARREAIAEAPAKLSALEDAEAELVKLRASADELRAQVKALPVAHRVDIGAAEEELTLAREKLAATERALSDARLQLAALKERDEARAAKAEEQVRAGRDARLAARMVTLLGRQGLQGQLLVDATRSLEALANETLTKLTGGALQLEIRFSEQRRRDELSVYARDYNAGGERTDAAYLSGSEKFRVCVAMAAAIGAYGSARYRVESLIIDEGFGSLDEQRRGEMIDELRRLAGLLERVIVVSHQADFQNRAQFPHGYRLRRVDGVTTVERYI